MRFKNLIDFSDHEAHKKKFIAVRLKNLTDFLDYEAQKKIFLAVRLKHQICFMTINGSQLGFISHMQMKIETNILFFLIKNLIPTSKPTYKHTYKHDLGKVEFP